MTFKKEKIMKPLVSIIMGSASDWTVMEQCAKTLNDFEIPFEVNALSAHRTPDEVAIFAKKAHKRGVKVIIAAAGMAAHLPGVIASMTPLPVVGVPIKASLEGWDAMLAILQMPPGIPVATVAVNGAQNAALLAVQILSVGNRKIRKHYGQFKNNLKEKIVKANEDFSKIEIPFKVN
jgi:5-(carboxyamino)imidazole ribonucleotide mutase